MQLADTELGSIEPSSSTKVEITHPHTPISVAVSPECSIFGSWSFDTTHSQASWEIASTELISPLELPESAFYTPAIGRSSNNLSSPGRLALPSSRGDSQTVFSRMSTGTDSLPRPVRLVPLSRAPLPQIRVLIPSRRSAVP